MARSFNASGDRATNATALSGFITASAGTFSCWYRPVGTPWTHSAVYGLPPIVVDKDQYVGLFRGSLNGTDKIYAYNYDGNADVVGFSYTVNVWVHVVWRHSGGNLYIYKDGAEQSPVGSGDTASLSSVSLSIADNQAGGGKLEGELAEMAFWNVALTPEEIAGLGKGVSPVRNRSHLGSFFLLN